MPALVWMGRRWLIGTDDFVLISVCSSILLLFNLITIGTCVHSFTCEMHRDTLSQQNTHTRLHCAPMSTTMRKTFLVLLGVLFVTIISFLLTAALSFQGSIFEQSRRRFVPLILYLDTFCVVTMLVVVIVCLKLVVHDGALDNMMSGKKMLLVPCLALNLFICFAYVAFFIIIFDSTGTKTYSTFEEYKDLWAKRLSFMCCECRRKKKVEDFTAIAETFAQAFRGYDIVLSDIAAGLLLLHGYQKCTRRIISRSITYPSGEEGWKEKVCSEARLVLRLTDEQREIVRELDQYFNFSTAILGWMFYESTHFGYGLCHLCLLDPSCCCRDSSEHHHGLSNNCDLTALRSLTGLHEEDIILSNWENGPYQPVYYVARDPVTNTVVIGVRGTKSLADCITDFTAAPAVVELDDIEDMAYNAEDYYVHCGMMKSAEYVIDSMETKGIFSMIEAGGPFSDLKIRILGHSLGAGVALIISVLIWSKKPALRSRLRCLAYSPPACTMSKAVMEYCKAFTVGCFLGYDLVPRLTPQTFDDFRESLFNAMATCKIPKSSLFFNIWRTGKIAKSFHPSYSSMSMNPAAELISSESLAYRKALCTSPFALRQESTVFYSCATLVHLRKTMVRTFPAWGMSWLWDSHKEVVYIPSFEDPDDVQILLSSPSMFSDHMPDRVQTALSEAVQRMDGGELERFYVDHLQPEAPEKVIPITFVNSEFAALYGST